MRQFYKVLEKWQTLPAKLSWSHFCEIIWFDDNKLLYYIMIIEEQNLSIRELQNKTKSELISKKETTIGDFIKNPIIIKNPNNYKAISEKVLQKLTVDNIEGFMNELGNYFCFIGSEYKIRIGNNYNYIDLLLYNIKYKCYVVIELK